MRWFAGVGVTLSLLWAVFGCCFPAGEAGAPSTTGSAPAPASPTPPSAQPTSGSNFEHALGETFELGSFRYTVRGVTESRELGSRFIRETAPEGAVFLVVRYRETNLGQETQVVSEGAMQLQDEMGRTFRPSSRGMAVMAMEGRADLAITELQPGVARDGVMVFEIPVTVRPRRILVVEERGALSTGRTTVLLRTRFEERQSRAVVEVLGPLHTAMLAQDIGALRSLMGPTASNEPDDVLLARLASWRALHERVEAGDNWSVNFDDSSGAMELEFRYDTRKGRREEPVKNTARDEGGRYRLVGLTVPAASRR